MCFPLATAHIFHIFIFARMLAASVRNRRKGIKASQKLHWDNKLCVGNL